MFSDLRFLKQIQQESKSKRKIKEWLILACRIMAITFLVFAFAQPFIPNQNQPNSTGPTCNSIYIDNSFSMNNDGAEGQLLEQAKTKARAIVSSYTNQDLFQIITNELSGKELRLLSKTDALLAIDDVAIKPSSKTLEEVYARQYSSLNQASQTNCNLFYISDFQESTTGIKSFQPDSSMLVHLVPLKANEYRNLAVDSVWLIQPLARKNEPVQLKVRILNYSNETMENIAVSLKINGVQKGLATITCQAGESNTTEIAFTPTDAEWIQGEINITDHPIVFDDKYYFTLKPVESSTILCINGASPSDYLNKVFSVDPVYRLINTNQSQIDFSLFKNADLIVLNETKSLSTGIQDELKKYITSGGQLLIIPSENPNDLIELNGLLGQLALPTYPTSITQQLLKVDYLNMKDDLFKAVFSTIPQQMDLPALQQCYSLRITGNVKGRKVIGINNDQPFLWQAQLGKGRTYQLALPLNDTWSNFQKHSLFVPVMLKIGTGIAKQLPMAYTLASENWIQLPEFGQQSAEKLVEVSNGKTSFKSGIEVRNGLPQLYQQQQISTAGNYQINTLAQKTPLAAIAFNYNRKESDLKAHTEQDFEGITGKINNLRLHTQSASILAFDLTQTQTGTPLWRVCVILALLFVLIEILLLKLK